MPTIAELRKVCRPNTNKNGVSKMAFYEAYNPYLSIYITWICIRLKLSANTVTTLMILISAIGALLIMPQNIWINTTGALLFLLSYLLDWSDGEVARWNRHIEKQTQNNIDEMTHHIAATKGNFLDKMYHHLTSAFLIIAISVHLYVETNDLRIIIGGLIIVILLFTKLLTEYVAYAALIGFFGNNDSYQFRATDAQKYAKEVYLPKQKQKRERITGTHGILKMYIFIIVALLPGKIQIIALIIYGILMIITTGRALLKKGPKTLDNQFNRFTITKI